MSAWLIYDLTRLIAAVALMVTCFFGPQWLAIPLVAYVLVGLAVSLLRWEASR